MSTLLFVVVLVVVGLVIYSTWKEIETENLQSKPELSIETIIETPLTDVVPPTHENTTSVTPQITDAVTVKKTRKPRTPKITDAGDQ